MSKSVVTETKDQDKPLNPYFYVFQMWKAVSFRELKTGLADVEESLIHKITKEKSKSYIDQSVDFFFSD